MIQPIRANERIEVIDILRGFAIFGILLVNMIGFNTPETADPSVLWPGLADTAVIKFILFFGFAKFVTLFSFLFGVGLAVQMSRAEKQGRAVVPFYLRRLLVLLLIGLAHLSLVWDGDILHVYAIVGFVLLLFRNRSQKTLLISSAVCLLVVAMPAILGIAASAANGRDIYGLKVELEGDTAEDQQYTNEAFQVYGHGSYAEMVELRMRAIPWELSDIGDLYILAIFLAGFAVGRSGILQNPSGYLQVIRRARMWCLGVGLIGNAVVAAAVPDLSVTSVLQNLSLLFAIFSAPALSFVYASTILLLAQDQKWRKRFGPLAAVGRMALSNYLLQSLICTTIFNSYGLGLYGKLSPFFGLILTVLIYAMQLPLSVLWLRRFQFGPAEWFWRSLSYLKLQPMWRRPPLVSMETSLEQAQ